MARGVEGGWGRCYLLWGEHGRSLSSRRQNWTLESRDHFDPNRFEFPWLNTLPGFAECLIIISSLTSQPILSMKFLDITLYRRSFSNIPSLRLTYLDLVYTTGKVKRVGRQERESPLLCCPPCEKSESDSRELFGLAGGKRALCTSFIKVCDKNPASVDFYGSNMRGKLTDAPTPGLHACIHISMYSQRR